MVLYTVLEPPDGKPDRVAFVPEGFAWGAFIFTTLWALWHRLWIVAAILFAIFAGLSAAVSLEVVGPGLGALLQFGISLIFGVVARQLQASSLEHAGFRWTGVISASCLEAAELTYFAGRKPPAPALTPTPTAYRGGPEDTLGIFGNV
jgi:hypothetical protein